jgi:hypothetical protein
MADFTEGQRPDRRRETNVRLTETVDSLLFRLPALDLVHAQRAFLENRIPTTIAARVLFHVSQRRYSNMASCETTRPVEG